MSRRRAIAVAIFVVLALAGLAADPKGIRHSWALLEDVSRLDLENQELRRTNEKLRLELRRLAEDPAALERAAREELGLVHPDDVIFHMEGGNGTRHP